MVSTVVLVIFMILTAVALERSVVKRALQAEKDQLQLQIYGLLAAVDPSRDGVSIVISPARLFESSLKSENSGLYALLHNKDRSLIWQSESVTGDFEPLPENRIGDWRFDTIERIDGPFFRLVFSIQWPDRLEQLKRYDFSIWKDASKYIEQLDRFRQTLWSWLIVTTILLLIVIYLILAWSLRPLARVRDEVKAIEDRIQTGFEHSYPTEIAPLTENLNILLKREQFQRQKYRHAMDDLAHSLKTPLAVMKGLSESGIIKGETNSTLSEQISRMNQIVSYQLQKASQVGDLKINKPIDMILSLGKILSAVEKVYQEKAINLETQLAGAVMLRMDEGDCLEVLGNLVDNAFKYGRQQVFVSTEMRNDHTVVLSVEDDGKGLANDELKVILNRGTRLDESHEGQGIGLAVVSDIVQSYNMDLAFSRSEQLGGLKVNLQIQVA
jgi:two-component system, OmpR family, sensor histidine kinase PhoQ